MDARAASRATRRPATAATTALESGGSVLSSSASYPTPASCLPEHTASPVCGRELSYILACAPRPQQMRCPSEKPSSPEPRTAFRRLTARTAHAPHTLSTTLPAPGLAHRTVAPPTASRSRAAVPAMCQRTQCPRFVRGGPLRARARRARPKPARRIKLAAFHSFLRSFRQARPEPGGRSPPRAKMAQNYSIGLLRVHLSGATGTDGVVVRGERRTANGERAGVQTAGGEAKISVETNKGANEGIGGNRRNY